MRRGNESVMVFLVDDVFEGSGSYCWQKNPAGRAQSALQRGFDVLFGAIGKLLGF